MISGLSTLEFWQSSMCSDFLATWTSVVGFVFVVAAVVVAVTQPAQGNATVVFALEPVCRAGVLIWKREWEKKNCKIKISQFPKKSCSLPLARFIFNRANGVPVLACLFKEKSREREKNILQKNMSHCLSRCLTRRSWPLNLQPHYSSWKEPRKNKHTSHPSTLLAVSQSQVSVCVAVSAGRTHGRGQGPRRCCPDSRCRRHTSIAPGCSDCSCRRTRPAGTAAAARRRGWLKTRAGAEHKTDGPLWREPWSKNKAKPFKTLAPRQTPPNWNLQKLEKVFSGRLGNQAPLQIWQTRNKVESCSLDV